MCLEIYLGSQKKLPLINWDEKSKGFHFYEVFEKKELEVIHPILTSKYYYSAGSHMGCSCGFAYGEWSATSQGELHNSRINDTTNFASFLKSHLPNNEIKLFCTWWNDPKDHYQTKIFNLNSINPDEFEFEEDVILTVQV